MFEKAGEHRPKNILFWRWSIKVLSETKSEYELNAGVNLYIRGIHSLITSQTIVLSGYKGWILF